MRNERTPRTPKEPRTGWDQLRSAVRWRYSEPEYRAVVATLLSDRPIKECAGTVLRAEHGLGSQHSDRLAVIETVLAETLGLGSKL